MCRGQTVSSTPFHLGPGALFKAIGGARFSFMVFGGSQVLMDIEPPARIIRGDAVLHGFSHTIAFAFAVAIASAGIGCPLSNFVLRHSGISDHQIKWSVALFSSFIGTQSHHRTGWHDARRHEPDLANFPRERSFRSDIGWNASPAVRRSRFVRRRLDRVS